MAQGDTYEATFLIPWKPLLPLLQKAVAPFSIWQDPANYSYSINIYQLYLRKIVVMLLCLISWPSLNLEESYGREGMEREAYGASLSYASML